jgi:hypothetical protein
MKYKLIREYPGSPKLGEIRTGAEENERFHLTQKCMENNPEYWEKIIEKDYEILSLISSDNTIITYENGGGCYKNDELKKDYKDKEYFLLCFLIHKDLWKINSIKRLSDNEIFSVGDKVVNPAGITFTISKFYLDSKSEKMLANGDNGNGIRINKISHVKFLLTTEDGVKIFRGDTCYCVIKKTMKVLKWSNILDDGTLDKYVYFSTKQSAEDFINKNKVLFVTEDGVDIKIGNEYFYVSDDFKLDNAKYYGKLNHDPTGICFGKLFSTKEAAEQYVALHKKQYSLNDFIQLMNRLKDEKS